jgi:hypothetical protein
MQPRAHVHDAAPRSLGDVACWIIVVLGTLAIMVDLLPA